ncbi:hypothetical protein OSB04_015188 [Centaurea solstitialis]|uniref:Senescence domain-containing protein n=1 Tax=Centaurea solstitialis TaxID=347529 RepID=A0AA38SYP7_9ASTR|nr:hypothetical protein OSB04_015188 [Centaurea solstitialis]
MSCCGVKKPRTLSPPRSPPPPPLPQPPPPSATMNHYPPPKNVKHEILLSIPFSKVHLMDDGEAVELAAGDFTVVQISDGETLLASSKWATTFSGHEPVVKLDHLHYLFSLPVMKNDDPLSYGVSFSAEVNTRNLSLLDKNIRAFQVRRLEKTDIDWKEFAPKVDAYNNFLAKAIANGTGQIVKGIFTCSNAYTNQVQKGGKMILSQDGDGNGGVSRNNTSQSKKSNGSRKDNGINQSLKSVRKLSKMTENMSKAMLNGVGIATGSVMGPVVRSQAGKAFFSMVPGEVLLASLDAVNIVMDAAEAAQKQTLSATSGAATRMVSERFGESAGEATGDVLATAGHVAGTAWNVVKIRKAINPATSVSSGIRKNATKIR